MPFRPACWGERQKILAVSDDRDSGTAPEPSANGHGFLVPRTLEPKRVGLEAGSLDGWTPCSLPRQRLQNGHAEGAAGPDIFAPACSRDDAGLPRRPEARASGSGTGFFPSGLWQQGRVQGGKDRIEAALAAAGLGEGGAGLAGGKPRGSVPGEAAGEPAGPGPA